MKSLLTLIVLTTISSSSSFGQCTGLAKGGGGIYSDGDFSAGILKDPTGNIYFCGTYSDTAYFDNLMLTTDTAIRAGYFLNKYDGLGNILWSKSLGNTNVTFGFKPIVISGNNIYISFGAYNFQDGADTITTMQIMLWKLDFDGNVLWRNNYPSSGGFTYTGSIISDGSSGVYLTGRFSDSLYINPFSLYSGGFTANKTWIARINSNGTTAWAKQASPTTQSFTNRGNDIARLSNQNIVISGYYRDSLQFGSNIITESLTSLDATFKYKPYIALFDQNGTNIWIRGFTTESQIPLTFFDCAYGVGVDNSDNIYFTGALSDSTSILGNMIYADSGHIFIGKFSMNGNLQWINMYGPNNDKSWGTSVLCDNNNLYLTGNFYGYANFGGVIDTAFNTEVFVAQLDMNGNMLKHLRSSGNNFETTYQAFLDNSGEIYTAGSYTSQILYFPTANNLINTNPGTIDTTTDAFFWKVCRDDLVSVDDLNQNENWFSVYPNPSSERVTINFLAPQKDGVITFLDVTGKQIHQTKFTDTEKIDIDLDGFSNGIYFVRLQANEFIATKKLLVEK